MSGLVKIGDKWVAPSAVIAVERSTIIPAELLEADDATRAEASRMLQGSASHARLATPQPKKRRPR